MKKLTKIMTMLVAFLLLASCGVSNGESEQNSTPDPDKLMDELVAALEAGDDHKVGELEYKLHNMKMTVDQAYRLIFDIEGGCADCPCDESEEVASTSAPQSQMRSDPVYLYYCKFCRSLVKATEWTKPGPNSGRCTQGYHGWMRVCEYGTQHGFRCSKCGLEVTTNSRPYQGNSCIQGDHQWEQLY